MGAVTALLHGDRDPTIAGMILDSPFSNLTNLAKELAKSHTKLPDFLVKTAFWSVKKTIKSKASFDVDKLTPIDHVKECYIPALFIAAEGDDFVKPHHTDKLYEAYAGDKNLVKVDGDHNSPRPGFFQDSAAIFFHNTLQVDALLTEQTQMTEEQKQKWKQKMEERRNQDKKQPESTERSLDPKQLEMEKLKELNKHEPSDIEKMMGLDAFEGEMSGFDMIDGLGGFGNQPAWVGGAGGAAAGALSEEDQIAAAIAASLADQKPDVEENKESKGNDKDEEEKKEDDDLF